MRSTNQLSALDAQTFVRRTEGLNISVHAPMSCSQAGKRFCTVIISKICFLFSLKYIFVVDLIVYQAHMNALIGSGFHKLTRLIPLDPNVDKQDFLQVFKGRGIGKMEDN